MVEKSTSQSRGEMYEDGGTELKNRYATFLPVTTSSTRHITTLKQLLRNI